MRSASRSIQSRDGRDKASSPPSGTQGSQSGSLPPRWKSSREGVLGIGRRRNRPGKLIVDWRDGGGVRHYREFPESKEGRVAAEELWVRVRQQARTGKILPDERLTFGEYFEAWMQATRHGLAENTVKSRAGLFACHLNPRFRKVPMVRVGRAAVRSLLAEMLEKGYKPGTVSQVQLAVSSMFSYAVDCGDLESNPVTGLFRAMKVGRGEGRESMSRDQLGQFLAAAREGPYYHVLSLLAFSGVRISEARGLMFSDIDFVRKTLSVSRQMHDTGEVARLKSRFSARSIEVPSSLCTLYRERASLPRKGAVAPGPGVVGKGSRPRGSVVAEGCARGHEGGSEARWALRDVLPALS